MPRQSQKPQEPSQPSQPSHTPHRLPLNAVKLKRSPSQTRIGFASVTINQHTWKLFDGLRVTSFVILKPSEPGGKRRVYEPNHQLPSGQRFSHLEEDDGWLQPLRDAILRAWDDKFGQTPEAAADADDEGHDEPDVDAEPIDPEDIPF